jgi:hypothetical protein
MFRGHEISNAAGCTFRLLLTQSGSRFPEQVRQPRDVEGDPSRLVVREHLRLPCIGLGLPTVEIRERLPGGITDNIAAGHLVGAPRSRSGVVAMSEDYPAPMVLSGLSGAPRVAHGGKPSQRVTATDSVMHQEALDEGSHLISPRERQSCVPSE